jgi:CRISPR-associated protein Cst1
MAAGETDAGDDALAARADLRLTAHPLQRCGARAIVALAGRASAAEVDAVVLDGVAEGLTRDMVRAAVTSKDGAAYDWWKVLFALYPNSPPTHSSRSRDPAVLQPKIAGMFADLRDGAGRPCTFCGQSAWAVWGKDKLPMFDSTKAVNTLTSQSTGWPVCQACRIAVWALPYGSWVTAGSATVLSCGEDAVERDFVTRNVARARRIMQLGFSGLPANASAETITLHALREHADRAPAGATLWMFKNDNQEPWLRVTATRGGIPLFLHRMLADPDSRRGWQALSAALTVRDKAGQVTASGAARAARTLFDPADRPGAAVADRLPRELLNRAGDLSRVTSKTLVAWRALCRLYLEVMYGMDIGQVKPVRELVTDWITQETNARGRFNEYARVSGSAFKLQKLLMLASARLLLDGRQPPDITSAAPALLAPDQDGWRLRGLLFFDVVADLAGRGVQIGQKTENEDEITPDDLGFPDDDEEGA